MSKLRNPEDNLKLIVSEIIRKKPNPVNFLYLFNNGHFLKCEVELLEDRYIRVLSDGEPTPLEDFGDFLLSNVDMSEDAAFEMWNP